MKKIISLFIVSLMLVLTLAACGGSPDYLSWKSADYNSASDSNKLKCVETFINATLKSQNSDELSGEDLTASAKAIQPILEDSLTTYQDKSVQDIIGMAKENSSSSAE